MKVTIFRFDPEVDKKERYETYEVPFEEKMRILNILQYIQKNFDGSLAFRANCRSGKCGSCAVEVNDKAVLACKQEVTADMKEIVIKPLKIFPVIKDLVTDMSETEKMSKLIPPIQPQSQTVGEFWKMFEEDVWEIRELKKCIECYICHDVCHAIRDHQKDFIGPRFVVKAIVHDTHPMDRFRKRYELLEKRGIWFCSISRCCQMNCPQSIRITDDAVIPAKERIMDRKLAIFLKKLVR